MYDATIDDWNCILNLADKWDFPQVKELAVRELHKKPDLDLIQKLALYQKYKVDPRHLVPLYAELCARDIPLNLEESEMLGFQACVAINTARERLRANPSDEGRSPLPAHLEEADVFRAIEEQIGMEEGSTAQFKKDNPMLSLRLSSKLFAGNEIYYHVLLCLSFIVDSPVGNGDKNSFTRFPRVSLTRRGGHGKGR